MGLFLKTLPMIYKQQLSYQEVGIIMMASMPYSFKILWAPFVEIYSFLPFISKRKAWVVPMQFISCLILCYLYFNLERLLEEKQVYFLSSLLIFHTFMITCQDISVDSLCVELLHPVNATYAAACQSVGLRTGMGFSTTFFIALNTVEFCNKWIMPKDRPLTEPLITIPSFIMYWALVQFVSTVYILVFVNEEGNHEKDSDLDSGEEEEEELEVRPSQICAIMTDILKNKNFLYFITFLSFTFVVNSIENNIATVYMMNDVSTILLSIMSESI